MRAGARKESVESRGSTSWNDGVYPVDGGGAGNGSSSSTQDSGVGTGGAFGGNEGGISQTTWFAPVDEIVDCPGGVCPVPWAVKEEPVFTIESPPVLQTDEVNHPPHYTDGGIETIEAIEAQLSQEEYEGYLRGNCVKYLWRWKHKGGVQDLKKCSWYLDRLIQTQAT